jgi:hypothetical protein
VNHIRTVLESLVKGRHVGPEALAAALGELEVAEALAAARTSPDMVFLAPEVTPLDEAILKLGTTFLILQQFMQEMHKKKIFRHVSGKVADNLIATSTYLTKHKFEFGKIPQMHFKPVVHDEPLK